MNTRFWSGGHHGACAWCCGKGRGESPFLHGPEQPDRAEPRRLAHQTDVIALPREPLPPRPGYPTTL
jgi:hypothetical protein